MKKQHMRVLHSITALVKFLYDSLLFTGTAIRLRNYETEIFPDLHVMKYTKSIRHNEGEYVISVFQSFSKFGKELFYVFPIYVLNELKLEIMLD